MHCHGQPESESDCREYEIVFQPVVDSVSASQASLLKNFTYYTRSNAPCQVFFMFFLGYCKILPAGRRSCHIGSFFNFSVQGTLTNAKLSSGKLAISCAVFESHSNGYNLYLCQCQTGNDIRSSHNPHLYPYQRMRERQRHLRIDRFRNHHTAGQNPIVIQA